MGFEQDTETAPKDKKERVSWVFGCKGTLELTQYVVALSLSPEPLCLTSTLTIFLEWCVLGIISF